MPYRALTIYFTTGTGNAFRGATWIVEAAGVRGITAKLVNMRDARPQVELEPGPEHLLGVMSPTHGFTAPWSVIKFTLRLPPGRGTHAFVAFTRAGTKLGRLFIPGLDGTACYLIALLLWLKGYVIRGAHALDLPSNWMSLHPGFKRPAAMAMAERQKRATDRFADVLLSGGRSFSHFVSLFCGVLLIPVSLGYLCVGRFFLAKLFFASERCNACGLCARGCPRQAIRMWGKTPRPYWTLDCESCMRCMAFCPNRAVEAGHSLAALILWLGLAVPLPSLGVGWLTREVPALAPVLESWWMRQVLGMGWFVLAAVVVYYVVAVLLRVPLLNKLFTYTTLTHWYHRYHEPSTKLSAIVGTQVELKPGESE